MHGQKTSKVRQVRTKSGRSGLSVSLAMNSRRSNSYMALSAPSPVARAVMRFSIIIARSSEAGISLLSIISGSRYIMVRGAKSCSCLRGSCGRVRRPAPPCFGLLRLGHFRFAAHAQPALLRPAPAFRSAGADKDPAPRRPSRPSACLPSVRYSGSRYFSQSAGGSTTRLSLSNTMKSLVAMAVACMISRDGSPAPPPAAGRLPRLPAASARRSVG
jgi:hypothetical protein